MEAELTVIIAILALGVAVAFLRATGAGELAGRLDRRATTLEERIRALEERLAELGRLASVERPAATAVGAAPPEPSARLPSQTEPIAAAVSRPVAVAAAATAPSMVPPRKAAEPLPVERPLFPMPPADAAERPGLEEIIGSRWLLFAGIAAIVLGLSYFVKFAFDNGWISEPLRVAAGVAAGLLLIGVGQRFSRSLALFGQALAGAGILVLYVSIYAALHFYALIPQSIAFALMVVVTAGAALLADRQRSQPLAALALLGGFATPLLVGGEPGAQVVLFTYMGILIAGAAALGRRHDWPLLGAASYGCTFVMVVIWCFSAYRSDAWLRTELFLTAYVAMFGYLLLVVQRSRNRSGAAQLAWAALATAPFSYHVASVILLNSHHAAWLAYAVLFTVIGLVAARRTGAAWMRLTVLLLVGLPMLVWIEALRDPRWYVPALVTLVALYAMHLAAQWDAADEGERLSDAAAAHVQLNGLLLAASLYVFVDTRATWLSAWIIATLSAWHALLAIVARGRAPRLQLHAVALAATLAAVAVVLAFDGPAVAAGWAIEGVAVGWLARRDRSVVLAAGCAALIALGVLQLTSLLAAPLPLGETPVANPRALAAALVIATLAWLASTTRDDPHAWVREQARTAIILVANLLALALLSAEVHAYFAFRTVEASRDGQLRQSAEAGLAEQVALSVSWALYAVALVFAGIRRRFAAARYLAIALFGVVVGKVLLYDIAGLDRFYRMLSVLGVGVLLLVASYLYQRRGGLRPGA